MIKVLYSILFGLLLLNASQHATAAFIYDEDISGDITWGTTLDFTIGTNTISGHRRYDIVTTPFSSDSDNFDFTLPVNAYISSVTYSYQVTENQGNPTFQTVINLREKSHTINSPNPTTVAITAGNGIADVAIDYLPITSLYQWNESYQSFNFHNERVSWDYDISFTVTSVPLPASGLLLLSGLFGTLGALRLKRAR